MSRSLRAHRGLHGLTKLRALSSLNLSDNNAVRDIGLEHLTRLCSLKHLDLSYTGVMPPDTAMSSKWYLWSLDINLPALLVTNVKVSERDATVTPMQCSV